MRMTGGYNIPLAGKPSGEVRALPDPPALFLPLSSRRFRFSEIQVGEGERVQAGRTLARDPNNFGLPLVAPRSGTARLGARPGHVVLEDLGRERAVVHASTDPCRALFEYGVWSFFQDAHTGALPDPSMLPRALVVSTMRLEPYLARGNVMLARRLRQFLRGLDRLHSILGTIPICLVLPDVKSPLGDDIAAGAGRLKWLDRLRVPRRYPFDHPRIICRQLGLRRGGGPVWAMGVDAVLAIDRVLTLERPVTARLIALAGPAVKKPTHLLVPPGYPLRILYEQELHRGPVLLVEGGVMKGRALDEAQFGVDVEAQGLTALAGRVGGRVGADAGVAPAAACISCGRCEQVCPSGLMPWFVHKALYANDISRSRRASPESCVDCRLCSYVCPSRIDLHAEMSRAAENGRTRASSRENARALA